MTTYSFIKYDVLKDLMYFKSTPTPDFKQTIKTEGISTEQDREYIEGIQWIADYFCISKTDGFRKNHLCRGIGQKLDEPV
jgi:hypothetical protein